MGYRLQIMDDNFETEKPIRSAITNPSRVAITLQYTIQSGGQRQHQNPHFVLLFTLFRSNFMAKPPEGLVRGYSRLWIVMQKYLPLFLDKRQQFKDSLRFHASSLQTLSSIQCKDYFHKFLHLLEEFAISADNILKLRVRTAV